MAISASQCPLHNLFVEGWCDKPPGQYYCCCATCSTAETRQDTLQDVLEFFLLPVWCVSYPSGIYHKNTAQQHRLGGANMQYTLMASTIFQGYMVIWVDFASGLQEGKLEELETGFEFPTFVVPTVEGNPLAGNRFLDKVIGRPGH